MLSSHYRIFSKRSILTKLNLGILNYWEPSLSLMSISTLSEYDQFLITTTNTNKTNKMEFDVFTMDTPAYRYITNNN